MGATIAFIPAGFRSLCGLPTEGKKKKNGRRPSLVYSRGKIQKAAALTACDEKEGPLFLQAGGQPSPAVSLRPLSIFTFFFFLPF